MQLSQRLPGMNQNTGALKLIALVTMVVDHVGSMFFPRLLWLRVIGRVSFPLFCWCLVVGAVYTRHMGRYCLRLAGMFLVSQPFYMIALNHPWNKPNVFMTLLLGLVAIWGLRDKTYWPTALALVLSYYLKADYGYRGVLCILLLYVLRQNPYALSLGFAAYCAWWGEGSIMVLRLPWAAIRLQCYALMALPLMVWPMPGMLAMPTRWMYLGYPVHLAVLAVIKTLTQPF